MRVSEFCRIAGADLGHFKNLRQRDQLPFIDDVQVARMADDFRGDLTGQDQQVVEALEAKVDAGTVSARWSTFSVVDAVRLRCQLDLMTDGGLEPSIACPLVQNSWSALPDEFVTAATAEDFARCVASFPEQWIGVETSTDGMTRYQSHYGGALADVFLASEARANRDRADFGGRRVRLILVNVSGAIRFVLDRLAEAG